MIAITEERAETHSRRKIYHPCPAHLGARLRAGVEEIQGVNYVDGHLVFDRRLHTEDSAQLVVSHVKGHPLAVHFQGVGKVAETTQDDLALINATSSVALTEDDVVVFERYATNDALQRSPLKFTRRALDKFVLDFAQGRGVHAQRQLPPYGHKGFLSIGRTFAARVESAEVRGVKANWLVVRFFVVKTDATPERLEAIQDIQTGVLGYDSIAFLGGHWKFQEVQGPDDTTLVFFEVDDDPEARPRLESVEVSVLSELGNVYGAGSNLSAAGAGGLRQEDDPAPEPKSTKPQEEIICLF